MAFAAGATLAVRIPPGEGGPVMNAVGWFPVGRADLATLMDSAGEGGA